MMLSTVFKNIALFGLGFLALSSTGAYILKDTIGMLYIPEALALLFFPFIYMEIYRGYKSIKKGLTNSPSLILTILLLLFLVFVGFTNSNSINDTLSVSRVFFVVVFSSYISRDLDYIETEKIAFICLGVLSGDVFNSIILQDKFFLLSDAQVYTENDPVNFSIMPIFLVVSITIIERRKALFVFLIPLLAAATIVSAYRVLPFVIIYSLVISLVYVMLSRRGVGSFFMNKDNVHALTVIFITVSSLAYVYQNLSIPKWRYYRLVTRTLPLLDMDLAQAIPGRIAVLSELPSAVSEHLLPNGFATVNEYIEGPSGKMRLMRGYHKDFPIIFLSYTFGLPLAIIIITGTLVKGIAFCTSKITTGSDKYKVDIISFLFFPLSLAMLFFNGRFLFLPLSEGMLFGLLIGRWFR